MYFPCRWRRRAAALSVAVVLAAFGTEANSSAAQVAPSTASSPSAPAGYSQLLVNDQFNQGQVESSQWQGCSFKAGCRTGLGNQEQQDYEPSQCTVSGGELHLVAQRQVGAAAPYRSCLLSTQGRVSFSYGYVQILAQMPAGQGLWPALWLVPSNNTWPPEIDLMEMIGQRTHTLVTTYHAPNWQSAQQNFYGADLTQWHTYGLAWSPGSITWYLDGRQIFRTTTDVTSTSMYLIMNLAVGGSWPGAVTGATPTTASMNVAYVRIWK